MISAKQVRAARASLGWSQGILAEATGLSVTTIRNLESGNMSPRSATMNVIRNVMETSGIEFTDMDGIKCRDQEIKVYRGRGGYDGFFDDLLRTVKDTGGEIVAVFPSHEILIESCGLANGKLGRLEPLSKYAPIKCLLSEPLEISLLSSSFQFRTILKQHIGPASYFVCGNKYIVVQEDFRSTFRFVVFNSITMAQDFRSHFYTLWEMAKPVFTELKRTKQHISI